MVKSDVTKEKTKHYMDMLTRLSNGQSQVLGFGFILTQKYFSSLYV